MTSVRARSALRQGAGTRKALRNLPFKPKLWAGGGRPYRGRIIINSSDLGLSTVDKICRHALIIMRRFFLGKLISGSFVPKISGLGGHGCWAQNWPGMRCPKVTFEFMAHLQMFSPPSAALLLWLRGHLAVAKGKNRAGGACGGPFLKWRFRGIS